MIHLFIWHLLFNFRITYKDYYKKTDTKVYFTVDAEGKIKIKGSNGYVDAVEITIYNQKEEDEIILVPATGLSSTITYVVGTLVVSAGAVMLYRNGKQN